jgi:hypothetical protein
MIGLASRASKRPYGWSSNPCLRHNGNAGRIPRGSRRASANPAVLCLSESPRRALSKHLGVT